jgi:DNA-binding IclR family transcriptional regulator
MQEQPIVKPIISRMMMDLLRIFQEVGFDNRDYGRNLENLYILLAVFIGHAEKRPMTAARISGFLGLPRSTVVRKLAQLIQSGHVSKEQQFYFLAHPAAGMSVRLPQARRVVLEAAKRLKELSEE